MHVHGNEMRLKRFVKGLQLPCGSCTFNDGIENTYYSFKLFAMHKLNS